MQKMKRDRYETQVFRFIRLLAVWRLLDRYWNGRATAREREALEGWDPQRQGGWTLLPERRLSRMNREVYGRVADALGFGQEERLQWERQSARWIAARVAGVAAAAAVVAFFAGGALFLYRGMTAEAPHFVTDVERSWTTDVKQRMRVTLPDGTRVMLNGGTTLAYAKADFGRTAREVRLDGEAFFEVATDSTRPFVVEGGELRVTVRGTSFNVKAYGALEENVVTVATGKVDVAGKGMGTAHLAAGMGVAYDRVGCKAQTGRADASLARAWMEGRLVFVNAGREELRLRLGQHYGVAVRFEGDVLAGARLNGAFRPGDGLVCVLDNICALYGLRYTMNDREVIIKY